MKTLFRILYLPFNYIMLFAFNVRYNKFRIYGPLIIFNNGFCNLGNNLRVNSSGFANVIGGDTRTSIVVRKGAVLNIGRNVSISNSAIYCVNNIVIEDYVMIGGSCKIWDSDFHPLDPLQRIADPNSNFSSKAILIKRSAFIGGGSIILKGVTIGENSIVGAGSVVTKNIPSNEIWGGNPARFIRKL